MANPVQIGQGGVVYNTTTLAAALRARLGCTSEVYSATIAETHLEDARVEINRLRPKIQLGSFSTVANQQLYSTVEAGFPATWTGGPPFVFWDGASDSAGSCSGIPLGQYNFQPLDLALAGLWSGAKMPEPWQIEQVIAKYNYLLRRFGARGWLTEGEQILLSPYPTAAVTVYYLIPVIRFAAVTDVSIRFREAFLTFAEARGAAYLAGQHSEIVSSEGPDGKDVRTDGGARWGKQAVEAENRFARLMAPGPMLARVHPGPRFV